MILKIYSVKMSSVVKAQRAFQPIVRMKTGAEDGLLIPCKIFALIQTVRMPHNTVTADMGIN